MPAVALPAEESFAGEPWAEMSPAGVQTPLVGLPDSDVATQSASAAIPPVRFVGHLLRHHPTVFWSGVWVITLLCSGIAVTGLMNPELSSQQEPPDPTGVGAVLRVTGLDQRQPASPALSFGLLAVSCAGCCLLLSRRFQQPQSIQRSVSQRSPSAKPLASKLQAIATIAANSTLDHDTSTALPDRPSWIDTVLSSAHPSLDADPAASAGLSVSQPSPSLDYLDYLRVHSQSKTHLPRSRQGAGRSPSRQPGFAQGGDRPAANPPADLASPPPPSIAPYTPDPTLPVAFLAPSPQTASASAADLSTPLSLPAAGQPSLNLFNPRRHPAEPVSEAELTLAELRKIQAKRAEKGSA